jgi:hypothetical protein
MAFVSFPFTRYEKLDKYDVLIFKVSQLFVNPLQKLKVLCQIENEKYFLSPF